MIVYTLGMIISVVLGWFYQKFRPTFIKKICLIDFKGQKHFWNFDFAKFIPMLPLIIISGIRYGVGQDYFYTYVPIFNKVVSGEIENVWGEIGYTYLNKFVALFTSDYAWIFVLTSIIFIYFVFKAIYKESDNIPFSIFLLVTMGYYFCFMNGIRQMLAASILMYSIPFVKQRNFKKFIICIIFATLFHTSSLLFVPVYFLTSEKISNGFMLISTIIIFATSNLIASLLLKIVSLTKYAWYLNSEYIAERSGFIMILINVMILIFALFFNKNKKNDIYIKIQWIAVLTMTFIGKIPAAHRLLFIFGMPGIILIPNVIASRDNRKERFILSFIIVILYLLYFIYTIGIKNSNSVLPYKTIFER